MTSSQKFPQSGRNKLKLFLSFSLLIGYFVFSSSAIAQPTEKPNIILIFVDDLGYGDIGCYGNETIKTPNLDLLAAEGQRWTSFYASGATCVPSRTGLMSGRHPTMLKKQPLKADREALLPAMLKRQGYQTMMVGKWHLAGYPEDFTTAPMHPLNCGFDSHLGTPGSNDAPGPPAQTLEAFDNATPETWKIPLIRGREVIEYPADQSLFTKRYTEEAVEIIAEASTKEEPFFLYLAHNMPHIPIFPSKEFEGVSEGGIYGDVVEEIDWSVGEVMKAVEEADVREDTLIIFTSDNGPWSVFGPRHAGTAKPLRGEKSTSWEGGFRVPGIFHWPGTIAPAIVDGIGVNLDLYATFATLTGAESLPDQKPGWMSTDLTSTLLDGEASPRNSWLFTGQVYRSGDHKIHYAIRTPTDPVTRKRTPAPQLDGPLLFDLSNDIGEENDIAAENPEIVERLQSEIKAITNPSK